MPGTAVAADAGCVPMEAAAAPSAAKARGAPAARGCGRRRRLPPWGEARRPAAPDGGHGCTRVPDARLLVVGDGPLRSRLERTAAREGLCGSVAFLGHLPRPELVARLQAAYVFVAPCRDLVRASGRRDSGWPCWRPRRSGFRWWSGSRAGAGTRCSTAARGSSSERMPREAVADGIAGL